jgi:SAM-dependent methyltransferase
MNALQAALLAVSPLDVKTARGKSRCKICGSETVDFDLVDANKFCGSEPYMYGLSGVGVRYVRCVACRFIFTNDFDAWSPEEFTRYIYNDDYIKVDGEYVDQRPRRFAAQLARSLGDQKSLRILDYGSGSGVFENAMRALGFDNVESYDLFSSPREPVGKFDLITCVEVVEHSPTPLATFQHMASFLKPGGVIFVQTGVQPIDIDQQRGGWWYIGPRNGHVSIFGMPSLTSLARHVGLTFTLGPNDELMFAFPDVTSELLIRLAAGAPRSWMFRKLRSPAGQSAQWHEVEVTPSQKFRWSKTSALAWSVNCPKLGRLDVELAAVHVIAHDFLSKSYFEVVGGSVQQTFRTATKIMASIAVKAHTVEIVLKTPVTISPTTLGGADARCLGVAVTVDSGS